jgi:hypothetical protein
MRTYTHPPTQPTPGKQEPFCAAPLVPLVLKDGHCYADRWGAVFLIMGDAKGADAERDGLCWSSAGHWFKRSTGAGTDKGRNCRRLRAGIRWRLRCRATADC